MWMESSLLCHMVGGALLCLAPDGDDRPWPRWVCPGWGGGVSSDPHCDKTNDKESKMRFITNEVFSCMKL